MYIHKDYPRDLIHKTSGKRREFKRIEDVPPGWFTVDGEEVNPVEDAVFEMVENDPAPPAPEAQDDAGEQTFRDLRGGRSDAKPRGKGRKRGHTEPVGSDPSVQDVEEPGGGSDG